ncbi:MULTISPECIES: hypothetical protein [unclassified Burkholderia]|uniref:hypothetical protein n=1 Tax=unclassified Burkholderia TaxID=2613784 RepID=UPI000F5FFA8E|nr:MULTISPECIES: hypothetical protein [unclassified Burkholderia]
MSIVGEGVMGEEYLSWQHEKRNLVRDGGVLMDIYNSRKLGDVNFTLSRKFKSGIENQISELIFAK